MIFKGKVFINSWFNSLLEDWRFGAASLVPFAPDRVISKLDIRLRTPTPFTEKELRRQASSIKALLRTRSRSPPSPSDRALNQLVKGFRLTMQGAILLAKENKDLRAANEKQKQKRTRSRRQIPTEEGLSVQEASQLITEPVESIEAPPPPPRRSPSPALQPRARAPPKCSGCGEIGHKINRCLAR